MKIQQSIVAATTVLLIAISIPACTSPGPNRTLGALVDDSVVTSRVKAALIKDEQVSGYSIEVDTYKGIVQLSGFAKSHAERARALNLTKAVTGVKDVRDAIVVKR